MKPKCRADRTHSADEEAEGQANCIPEGARRCEGQEFDYSRACRSVGYKRYHNVNLQYGKIAKQIAVSIRSLQKELSGSSGLSDTLQIVLRPPCRT